jgi:phosphoglycerate dehydrogenase-like enzyme
VHDPFLSPAAIAACGAMGATLGQVLQDSDFVSLHVPLTSQTHHLISTRELQLMRPHSILINTCRGSVIDEPALITALSEGWIGGAGLDVMEKEPIGADHPLCQFANVVLAPHCASRSSWADAERLIRPAQEVVAVLAGLRPRATWNSEVLENLELR